MVALSSPKRHLSALRGEAVELRMRKIKPPEDATAPRAGDGHRGSGADGGDPGGASADREREAAAAPADASAAPTATGTAAGQGPRFQLEAPSVSLPKGGGAIKGID